MTETLDLRLTDEEIESAEETAFETLGDGRNDRDVHFDRTIADAATRKAAYGIVEWLKDRADPYAPGPQGAFALKQAAFALAEVHLPAAGVQRPE